MNADGFRRVYDLSTWTGRVTLAIALVVAAAASYVSWDARRLAPVETTLAKFPNADAPDDGARLLVAARHHEDVLDEVVGALHSARPEVRLGSLRMLVMLQTRRSTTRDLLPPIRERALDPAEDQYVRGEALAAGIRLHAFRAPDDVERLRAIAAAPQDWSRSGACRALASLGELQALADLNLDRDGNPLPAASGPR